MELFIEPSMRRVVADRLGVGAERLTPAASLRDELAADGVDLLHLTAAIEQEFSVVMPYRVLDRTRTYGELVEETGLLIRERRDVEARGQEAPPQIWVRIVPPAGATGGTMERADRFTPYVAETIADDALRAGPGTRVEVTVAASAAACARVRHRFARLVALGIELTVRCDHGPGQLADGAPSVPTQATNATGCA